MQKEKLVPAIRFKGFEEEWKEKKINQILIPIVSNLTMLYIQEKGLYPVYDANNIVGYSSYALSSAPYLTIIKDGAGVGRTRKLPANSSFLGTMTGLIPKNSDIDFTYNLMSSLKLEKNFSGSTIPHIYFSDYGKYLVYVPSIIEQQKIGLFLSNLDILIDSQEIKLESLQTIKQSLLDKMFTSCEQKIPEIRFKGFDKKWSEKCIDELFSSITDFTAAGSFADMRNNVTYYNKPNYAQLIRITDLKNEFKNANSVYVDKHAYDFLWRVQLNKECIVISNIGNCGEAFYIDPNKLLWEFNALAPNAIMLYTSSNSHKFLLNAIKTFNFQNILKNIISPNGQTKFNKTEFKELNLIVPTFDEQQKIGQFFSNWDSLIHSQEQKLEKLNNIKQALLEKMFC
ncbi:restriction endonuclease subunit S [Mycoplasma sp. VS292A]|uniref:restriction endonuclease subunit S n=1 Tax=Mycoplasma sp. VS292A TaxID=3401680 RepID=UPI003AAF72DA